jgi:hypothetical protein
VEAVERRALLLMLAVALVLVFDRPADFTTQRGTGWQVVIYVLGLVSLAAAAALLVIAVAPQAILELPRDRRERLVFFAWALLGVAILAMALLRAYATYYLHRHGSSIFGG